MATISNVKIINVSQTAARITFDTSEACNTELVATLVKKAIDNSFITATYTEAIPSGFTTLNHAIDISALTEVSTYIVAVSCLTVATPTLVTSSGYEFITLGSSLFHTTAEVKTELKNVNTTSTNAIITEATLQSYCNQTEAVVIGEISKKYVLPITLAANPISYNILKQLCVLLTASRANKILRRNAAEQVNAGDGQRSTGLTAEAKEMYDKVINQKILLTDAARIEATSNTVKSNDEDELTRTFDTSNSNWW